MTGGNGPEGQGGKGPCLLLALEAEVTGMKALWMGGMGEAAATQGLRHVLSAGRDRQGDRDWLSCSWSCHSSPVYLNKTLILHLLLELSASQRAAGSRDLGLCWLIRSWW